jgi:hypothetical protein
MAVHARHESGQVGGAVRHEKMEAGVDRGHEERRGHALARDVGDAERRAPVRERVDVEVIAPDLLRRPVPAGHEEPRYVRERLGENGLLDGGGELDLPLHLLLLDRLAVQARVLERDRGLIREERRHALVGFGEVVDRAVAILLVGHDEHAEPASLGEDRHGEELLGRGVHEESHPLGERVAAEHRRGKQPRGHAVEKRLAEMAYGDRAVRRAVAHDERPRARIEERDGLVKNVLGEQLEIEGARDGEPDVVQTLQLPDPVLQLEVRLLHLVGHPHRIEEARRVCGDRREADRL